MKTVKKMTEVGLSDLRRLSDAEYEARATAACEILRTANPQTLKVALMSMTNAMIRLGASGDHPSKTLDLGALVLAEEVIKASMVAEQDLRGTLTAIRLLDEIDPAKMAIN